MPGPPFAHGQIVEVWRTTAAEDEYGNTVPGPYAKVQTLVGCGVSPRKEDELQENGRTGVIVGWTVFAPYDGVVLPHDRLLVNGELFDVEGEPGRWSQPMSGWTPGLEINIKRVEG